MKCTKFICLLFVFGLLVLAKTVMSQEKTTFLDPKLIVLDKSGSRRLLNDSLAPREGNEDTFLPILQGETIEFKFGASCEGCVLVSSDTSSVAVIDKTKLLGIQKNMNVTIKVLQGNKEFFIESVSGENRSFIVRVVEESADRITSETTFLSYRDVRDNFGKRIANTYIVVQLTINNQSPNNQFYVQDIGIMLDPSQCTKVDEYFKKIKPYQLGDNYESPKAQNQNISFKDGTSTDEVFTNCLKYYQSKFLIPTPVTPMDRNTVLAIGNAGALRSKRKIGFSAIRFVADLGSVFSGLKLLGSDGIKGFNFLGTNILNSADNALPNVAGSKLENLQKSLPEGPMIVNTRSAKVVNLFIPLDRIFSNQTWREYTKLVKTSDSDDSSFKLKMMTEMFLVSQVEGVLINDNAPKFTLRPGGGLNNVDKLSRP
jgi:hypothetical protein